VLISCSNRDETACRVTSASLEEKSVEFYEAITRDHQIIRERLNKRSHETKMGYIKYFINAYKDKNNLLAKRTQRLGGRGEGGDQDRLFFTA